MRCSISRSSTSSWGASFWIYSPVLVSRSGESSGEVWNSWLGKPRATHTRLLHRLFSERRHRSNYTHINAATRFGILQRPADARRERQTWPNLKIILFSPGSTVWSSCVETIKNFQALRKQSLCIPQISSRGQCLHVTMDFFGLGDSKSLSTYKRSDYSEREFEKNKLWRAKSNL